MSKAHFRTNVLLKSIIGKDLITDDNVAVLELVKNSFDANSKKVEIIFENILRNDDSKVIDLPTPFTSKIIILDKGIGMNEDDINNKWLNIAYSEKKEKKEEFGRTLAGNKGVGRFSCDRLGQYLDIYTRKKDSEYVHLFIDWEKFEIDNEIDLDIQNIELEIETLSQEDFIAKTGFTDFKRGTILEISRLREQWGTDKIIGLKRQLEKLINPNQAFRKNIFNIEIKAQEFETEDEGKEDFEKINGIIKNKIFEKLNFKTSSIESIISEDGSSITTTMQDRGRDIFKLVEKNQYKMLKNIKIAVYYLSTYSKMYFTRQTGIRSVDFGSISLFINGFRIPPYGDQGDDWLGLEIRKGQGFKRYLGTREIVGRIEIKDTDEQFKIISSRTGVLNNAPFNQLTKSETPFGYFYKTFRRLERFVVEGINWDSVPKDEAKRVEKLIENNSWQETKEIYVEEQSTRDNRILEVINKILDVRKDNVIELVINEGFVKEILDEQTKNAKEEIENIVTEVATKNLNSEQLTEIFERLNKQAKSLNELTSTISNISGDSFSGSLEDLEILKLSVNDKHSELELLKQRLLEAEKREKELQEAIEIEKQKNTYFKATDRTISEDAKGLIHNIKITTKIIKNNIETLYEEIGAGKIKEKEILTRLSVINFNAEKALKISQLITRSNFKTQADKQFVDICKFVTQYIHLYSDIYDSNALKFKVNSNNEKFEKRISILDLSLVFDDLISNSRKATAKSIQIDFRNPNVDSLEILFSDSGNGVDDIFAKKYDNIFDLGVTTTDGSGIGLHSVRKTLKDMGAKITFEGNGIVLKGASFKINF